ncbi:MAG: lipase family protein [Gammaproteobacteria bacterium]|nr:lipase family protein [Gammaproteobacteria bacterium]
MKKMIQTPFSKSFRLLSLFLMALMVTGCGPLLTKYADSSRFDEENETSGPNLAGDEFLNEVARRFGLMALFAEVVYRRDLDKERRDQDGCNYTEESGSVLPTFGMPTPYPEPTKPQKQWKRWTGSSHTSATTCFNESGLYYETYVLEEVDGKLLEAVIAFRGTENRPGQYISDWSSNVAAAFMMEPKQYRLAREQVPKLISALREQNPEIKIYSTGHSLGGGLAQQAGYLSKHVLEVFTFNTSPVTNWSRLRLEGEVDNAYPIFHRVYHGGEILEKIRFVTTSFTHARFGRHDLGLQLDSRSSFGGHSMQIIACTFAEILAQPGMDYADHFYPVNYIESRVISGNSKEQVCG